MAIPWMRFGDDTSTVILSEAEDLLRASRNVDGTVPRPRDPSLRSG
jgi:hypothetical protein